MTNAIHYLEAAKADQVAAELESEGYSIVREPQSVDDRYDLIATKDGKTIAIEIKARSTLRQASKQIRRLREQAFQRGYNEFRLVIANPPREKTIVIEGLEGAIKQHLTHRLPESLYHLAPRPQVRGVSNVEIDSVNVSEDGIHVIGTGFVDLELEWMGEATRNGRKLNTDLPLSFDITLTNDLQIAAVHLMSIDTSSFDEE